MSWIRDLTGKVVTYLGSTMPDRRNLIIRGTGVTVTDDPAQEATVLDFSAGGGTGGSVEQIDVSGGLTVGSPTGPVVSISASSLQGQLVNLSNDVDAAEQSIADLESLDAGNRLNTLETEQTDQGNRITLVERGTFTITSTGIVNISNSVVGKTVIVNTSAETNLLLSESGIDIGSKFRVIRAGTGEVSLSGTGSTSVERSRFTTSQLAGQYSEVEVVKVAANTWVMNGDLKQEKPILKYRLDGVTVNDGQPFDISNVVAQGGFSSGFTDTSAFVAPIAGEYRFTFNASLAWSDSGGSAQFVAVVFERKNTASSGYTRVAAQQIDKGGTYPTSAEVPLNMSFIVTLSAGQEFRILPVSSTTITPDTAANDRNECFIEWIGD